MVTSLKTYNVLLQRSAADPGVTVQVRAADARTARNLAVEHIRTTIGATPALFANAQEVRL